VLLGGCTDGPQLFWIDHLATLTELPFAAHGYAAYFVLSLMDRHYRKGMNVEEGIALLKMCLQELKTRFIVNLPEFSVRIVKATGIEKLVISL
jgi:20S proteasome subunit beta 4